MAPPLPTRQRTHPGTEMPELMKYYRICAGGVYQVSMFEGLGLSDENRPAWESLYISLISE